MGKPPPQINILYFYYNNILLHDEYASIWQSYSQK